jgi:hypothetical protein
MTGGDAVARWGWRRRVATVMAVVVALALGTAAAVFWRRARVAEKTLQRVRTIWSGRCHTAKIWAVGEIDFAVKAARRGLREIDPIGAPGKLIDAYVRTCAGERSDARIEEMAGTLKILTLELYAAGKWDELEALAKQLHAATLDEWPALALPVAPPIMETILKDVDLDAPDADAATGRNP